MILANYFSAWIGWLWLLDKLSGNTPIDIYNVQSHHWKVVALAYVLTLLLEWPFVFLCLWKIPRWFLNSLIATLVVQTLSYALLFGWYNQASVNSLTTHNHVVPLSEITLPADVRLYYISADDGHVYTRELTSDVTEKVFDLNSNDPHDCLSFREAENDPELLELVVLIEIKHYREEGIVPLGIFVPKAAWPVDTDVREQQPVKYERNQFPTSSTGYASVLGTAADSPWSFRAGYWPMQGLRGENKQTGAQVRVALELPVAGWTARQPIHLPEEWVLFQFGNRQICVFDPETRKLAVLCYGRGAMAVSTAPPATTPNKKAADQQ